MVTARIRFTAAGEEPPALLVSALKEALPRVDVLPGLLRTDRSTKRTSIPHPDRVLTVILLTLFIHTRAAFHRRSVAASALTHARSRHDPAFE
jgi:hypothetical protein